MDSEKKDLTIYDLEQRLKEQIESIDEDHDLKDKAKRRGLSYEEAKGEAISEIIDGLIPIYNYDLLTVACSDLWLGEEETECEAKTAHQCLREAIARHLDDKATEILAKQD